MQKPAIRDFFAKGERKQLTVLFSDLSSYSLLARKMDPEELREIMTLIFEEINRVAVHYEGFVDRFFGDEVLILFGFPKAHEDDPVRAVKAAMEIHGRVESLSPRFEASGGVPLVMHSGIESGLAITGEEYIGHGKHGLTGEAVNLAAQLTKQAAPGEILVGPATHRRAEGHFDFDTLNMMMAKGRDEPVPTYRVLSKKVEPGDLHRFSGLRAELIGRETELVRLEEALADLRRGRGSIISICGGPGTGKSRLAAEMKALPESAGVKWQEVRFYPYAQNIPYHSLIEFLNRSWDIDEGLSRQEVREKVEKNIEGLLGRKGDTAYYIGNLYSLDYPGLEEMDPEFWKARLKEAVRDILEAMARESSTVVYLEDIHWSDPSTIDLLRFILSETTVPALFLMTYRPPFSLFSSQEVKGFESRYREIELKDLSTSEAQRMLASLLKTDKPPPELSRFIEEKVEGNPFYLEEVVNAMIESGSLVPARGRWALAHPISKKDIPLTISGVISARLDHLEGAMKRTLQEASVMGRAFLYDILKKITRLKDKLDGCLGGLESLDLIRMKSTEPELEYIFKHALTQDVAYNGLLKKERQEIHEKIARVMEETFSDRLSEFCETLAYHFTKAKSLARAVSYLLQSGEKSLKRYSLEEADGYYREAFKLLETKKERTMEEDRLMVDILLGWMLVFYYRGYFREMADLLEQHHNLIEELGDRRRLAMFYMWNGMTLMQQEKFRESYEYLSMALRHGEEIEDWEVVGYSSIWLAYTCADLGRLDEAVASAEKALEIGRKVESRHYPYHLALGGRGYVAWVKGECSKASEMGEALLEYGRRHSNIRSLVFGHWVNGFSHLVDGDFPAAVESNRKAIKISADPWYAQFPKLHLGLGHVSLGRYDEARQPLEGLAAFCEDKGGEILGNPARGLLGAVLVAGGEMSRGLRMLEKVKDEWMQKGCRWRYANAEYVFGLLYLNIVVRASPIGMSLFIRNIGFLLMNVPFAGWKSEEHFKRAIAASEEIGAEGQLARACFDLARLYRIRGRKDLALENLSRAAELFEKCGAETSLKEAREILANLS